ncbi:MAG: NUDIX domain-containing protein [Chloroflexi bacterium]|nr:NUDIX domain-containing protein [Chloroflexota bacterium]
MVKSGANVAIIQDGKILLTKRQDFEVWCLPGGHVDPGESVAYAAKREAVEETGLTVELTRFIGLYSRLGGEHTIHLSLFAAEPVGGVLNPQLEEVLELAYFAPDALPEHMFWWHRQQIQDAFAGVTGAVWSFEVVSPVQVPSRQALYDLQAKMGLAPTAFYEYFFESEGTHRVERHV